MRPTLAAWVRAGPATRPRPLPSTAPFAMSTTLPPESGRQSYTREIQTPPVPSRETSSVPGWVPRPSTKPGSSPWSFERSSRIWPMTFWWAYQQGDGPLPGKGLAQALHRWPPGVGRLLCAATKRHRPRRSSGAVPVIRSCKTQFVPDAPLRGVGQATTPSRRRPRPSPRRPSRRNRPRRRPRRRRSRRRCGRS